MTNYLVPIDASSGVDKAMSSDSENRVLSNVVHITAGVTVDILRISKREKKNSMGNRERVKTMRMVPTMAIPH